MESASMNSTKETSSSQKEIRKYSLRDKSRTAQRIYSNQEIQEMMDTDRESNESECSGISEFDESNVLDRIETDVDDIAGYRDVILQSISKGQSMNPETNTTPEPVFLKNLGQKGYRKESSPDSDEETISGGISSSNRKRMASTPKNRRGKGRKISKPLLALTHGRMNLIIQRFKQELGQNVKVTETRILNDFTEQENLLSLSSSISKWAHNRIAAYRKKLRDLKSKKKDCPPLDDVVFDLKGNVNPVVSRGPKCQFSEMSREGKRKRVIKSLDRIQKAIIQICEEDDIPIDTMNIQLKKKFANENIKKGPSGIETLAHMVQLNATKRISNGISKFTKKFGLHVPGERVVRKEKRKRLPDYHVGRFIDTGNGERLPVGVFVKRRDMVLFTVKQLFELKKIYFRDTSDTKLILHMKFNQGFDGASSHPQIFDQESIKLSKVGHSLKSCQTFAIVLVTCSTAVEKDLGDGNTDATPMEELYKCSKPNSYKNMKVLSLVMEAESADLQKFLMEKYPDGKEVYTFKMDKSQREVIVYSEYSTCMVDGKSRKAMMGRGGAYCYHCSTTIEAYHTPAGVRVEDSFIEYNTKEKMEEYKNYLASNGLIDTGEKSVEREGWTQIPYGLPEGVVVTHASLNIAKWVVQLATKANIYSSPYTGSKTWEMRGEFLKAQFKLEEDKILVALKQGPQRLTLKDVGHGNTGSGLTGNHAKTFLCHAYSVLPPLLKDVGDGKKVGKIAELLYVVIRVLNTEKEIDLTVYKHVCHTIGILVINHFPWARMNETLHDVLAHSWEIIRNNKCRGLKNMSEEGIEYMQKDIRNIRSSRSWLGNYITNLGQTLETAILRGDLFLNHIVEEVTSDSARSKQGRNCKEKKIKSLYPDDVISSSELGGINFLKKVIIGYTE